MQNILHAMHVLSGWRGATGKAVEMLEPIDKLIAQENDDPPPTERPRREPSSPRSRRHPMI